MGSSALQQMPLLRWRVCQHFHISWVSDATHPVMTPGACSALIKTCACGGLAHLSRTIHGVRLCAAHLRGSSVPFAAVPFSAFAAGSCRKVQQSQQCRAAAESGNIPKDMGDMTLDSDCFGATLPPSLRTAYTITYMPRMEREGAWQHYVMKTALVQTSCTGAASASSAATAASSPSTPSV